MSDLSEAVVSKPADHLRTLHEKDQEKRLIVVLEKASLETVKVCTSDISYSFDKTKFRV